MLVLALFAVLFLLKGGDWIDVRRAALSTQFTTGITHIGGRMLLAAILLAATAALGRWYCSLLCPAGLMQDLFSRLGRKLGVSRLGHAKPPFAVNLVFLFLATVFAGVALLDPAALFGTLASGAGGAPLFFLPLLAAAILLVVVPLFLGRLFCDAVCPAGTLFRLMGRLPGFRMGIDPDACAACGKCEAVCPARCIDAAAKTIDSGRCVLCFDCAASCRLNSVTYRARGAGAGEGRRHFLGSAGAAILGGGYVVSREAKRRLGVGYADPARVAPPGSGGGAAHAQKCVGCQACVPACPVGIIRPDGMDSRPVLDYRYGYCQYSCMDCLRSCPAGVFADMSLEEKQRTRIARVELDMGLCVVETLDQDCGACAEVCPTHAVTMAEREGCRHTVPDFDAAHCIGCGACFHVCPASPRAFAVAGLANHEQSSGIRETGHGGEDRAPGELRNDWGMTDFPF